MVYLEHPVSELIGRFNLSFEYKHVILKHTVDGKIFIHKFER